MAKMVKRIPMERILLETDAPALSPEKGQINEPQNLRCSALSVAELKNISVEEVVRITGENSKRLFRLSDGP